MVRGWSDPGVTRPVYGAERERGGKAQASDSALSIYLSIYMVRRERERERAQALDSALSEPAGRWLEKTVSESTELML